MRGAPPGGVRPHEGGGIIPARAGSTRRSSRTPLPARDHPRSCGEHCGANFRMWDSWGSSPLVRGAPRATSWAIEEARIIPARAGSTMFSAVSGTRKKDHPRSCGEHWSSDVSDRAAEGSSPLVRGALRREAGRSLPAGIIPARAGSTSSGSARSAATRDHPRSCGEHIATERTGKMPKGSSPLVRGARMPEFGTHDREGIIPARAGST